MMRWSLQPRERAHLLAEARLILPFRLLLYTQPFEGPCAGVPSENGVVIARLTKLLRLLERFHRGAQRVMGHRFGVHDALRELRVTQPLVDDARVVRFLIRIGNALEHL